MKRRILLTILAGLLIAATSTHLAAQDAPAYYQVEIIVLKHLDQSRTTREIPRVAEQEMADILDQDLPRLEGSTQPPAGDGLDGPNRAELYLVNENEYLLKEVEARLRKSGAYEILAHRSWLQTAPEAAEALELNLADLEINPAVATGGVSLYQRRYLHFAVDMSLGGGLNANPIGSAFQTIKGNAAPSIADSRRIRLEKLVYYDQPQFGVLAYVARSDFKPAD